MRLSPQEYRVQVVQQGRKSLHCLGLSRKGDIPAACMAHSKVLNVRSRLYVQIFNLSYDCIEVRAIQIEKRMIATCALVPYLIPHNLVSTEAKAETNFGKEVV